MQSTCITLSIHYQLSGQYVFVTVVDTDYGIYKDYFMISFVHCGEINIFLLFCLLTDISADIVSK